MAKGGSRSRKPRPAPLPAAPKLEPLLFDLPLETPARRRGGAATEASGPAAADRARDRAEREAAAAVLDPPAEPAPAAPRAPAAGRPPRRPPAAEREAELELSFAPERVRRSGAAAAPASREPQPAPATAPETADFATRLRAGVVDAVVQLAVLAGAVAGLRAMGIAVAGRDLPALGLLLVVFSFLYTVVPLIFWGHTPGMVAFALRASDGEDGPLPFGVAVRRWLGGLLTAALAGLPLLLALRGASLSDRLSGTRTLAVARRA